MTRPPPLPLALALLAGCAAAPPAEERLAQSVRASDCGLREALEGRLPRPGSGVAAVESGDAVRACALPTAAEIEASCEVQEAVPIAGSSNPDNPEAPLHRFPEYMVTGARCAFTDPGRSRADCRFAIAVDSAAAQPARAELTYRFRDLSNDIMHGWHRTAWEADASCLPGGGEGAAGAPGFALGPGMR